VIAYVVEKSHGWTIEYIGQLTLDQLSDLLAVWSGGKKKISKEKPSTRAEVARFARTINSIK
jgi:hypothetical protein